MNANRAVNQEIVTLEPWMELRGTLELITDTNDWTTVTLSSGVIRVHSQSREADILQNRLDDRVGNLVSILRTDLPERPIAILIEEGDLGG